MSTEMVTLKLKDIVGGKDGSATVYTVMVGNKVQFQLDSEASRSWVYDSSKGVDGVLFVGPQPNWLEVSDHGPSFVCLKVTDASGKGQTTMFTLYFKSSSGQSGSHDPGVSNGGNPN